MKFKDWHKVHDADDHAVFENKVGHQLKVAKGQLTPAMRKALEALPKHNFVYGGKIKKAYADGTPDDPINAPDPSFGPQKDPKFTDPSDITYPSDKKAAPIVFPQDSKDYSPQNKAKGGEVNTPQPQPQPSPKPPTNPIGYPEGASLSKGGQIPHYADGTTDVQPGDQSYGTPSPSDISVPDAQSTPIATGPNQEMAQPPSSDPAPQVASQNGLPAGYPGPKGDTGGYDPRFEHGAAQEVKSNTAIGNLEAKQAKAQVPVYQNAGESLAVLNKNYTDQQDQLHGDIIKAAQAAAAQPLDYHRYLGSMDTGKKILTGIGLILGGIGAPATGGRNAALDFLNQNIDRDIQQQKDQLGQKDTLYSHYLDLYKSAPMAQEATALTMHAAAGMLTQAAALKQGGPLAQQRAQLLNAQLEQNQAPRFNQLAWMRSMNADMNHPGQLNQADPAQAIQFSPIGDSATKQKAIGEVGVAQNVKSNYDRIMSAFDQGAKDISGIGRVESQFKMPRSVQEFHALLGPSFADTEGTVRQAAMDSMYNNTTPKWSDTDADIQTKRAALDGYLRSKMAAPHAKSIGVDLHQFESTALPKPVSNPWQQQSNQPEARVRDGHTYIKQSDGNWHRVK